MQFSAQVTGAVALFLFSLPALATTTAATHTSSVAPAPHASGSATASAPTASGTGKSGVMMPQDPQVVLSNLKDYHQAASDELTQCAKARSLPLCLARGITIPAGKTTLTDAESTQYTTQYFDKLGSELGDCTKKSGFKACKDRIVNADDNKQLSARDGLSDFFTGFVKGFTGVFNVVGQVLPVVAQVAELAA